ncbi:addiction module antidote protein [Caulobacter sp.]|uniref:addiction module antidote protein n=1 Tax=Caulobacter sp. TaxID=78 RepID=UPI001B2B8845|nr:addiction module antidote protein [Caulobacter sp.]MBO9543682.1 putative addiction module antidote protein [Caulobacter sp.]
MTLELRRFDPANYLEDDEDLAIFLTDCLESGHTGVILDALSVAARVKGMTEVAEKAGLGRESLYKALKDGASPRFDTVLRVIQALGLKLTVSKASEADGDAGDEAAA